MLLDGGVRELDHHISLATSSVSISFSLYFCPLSLIIRNLCVGCSGVLTEKIRLAGHHLCQLLPGHLAITALIPFVE